MNTRAYLTILRPGRGLAIAALFSLFLLFGILTQGRSWDALCFTLAVMGPVVVGRVLVGPIHEVMHRSFVATLPGGRRVLRRWHAGALALATLLFCAVDAGLPTGIPLAALAGITVAGLALPALMGGMRLGSRVGRAVFPYLLILGAMAVAWDRPMLVSVCQYAPWAVLLGGIGLAVAVLSAAFSERQVRPLFGDPLFFCEQSLVPFLGSEIHSYVADQARQKAAARLRPGGSGWTRTGIGRSVSDWLAAIHYARYGACTYTYWNADAILAGAVIPPVFILTMGLLATGNHDAASWRQFLQQVTALGRLEEVSADRAGAMLLTMVPTFAWFAIATVSMIATVPTLLFPISRDRLSACLFADAHRKAALGFLSYLASTLICFLAMGLIAGNGVDSASLKAPIAAACIVPALTTLTITTLPLVRNGFLRLVYVVAAIFGIQMADFLMLKILPRFVLSLPGLIIVLSVTALAVALSWRLFRRHFRSCDLARAHKVLRSLGLTAA